MVLLLDSEFVVNSEIVEEHFGSADNLYVAFGSENKLEDLIIAEPRQQLR